MADFQKEIADHKCQLNQQKREIHLLKVIFSLVEQI